jgi:hypothetical protein
MLAFSQIFLHTYQSIHFWIIQKERFPVPFLMLHKSLDIHIKALRIWTFGRLSCLLTSFEQERQQRE